jgi:hypothetical protein
VKEAGEVKDGEEGVVKEEEEGRLNVLKNLTRKEELGIMLLYVLCLDRDGQGNRQLLPTASWPSSHICSLIVLSTRDSQSVVRK